MPSYRKQTPPSSFNSVDIVVVLGKPGKPWFKPESSSSLALVDMLPCACADVSKRMPSGITKSLRLNTCTGNAFRIKPSNTVQLAVPATAGAPWLAKRDCARIAIYPRSPMPAGSMICLLNDAHIRILPSAVTLSSPWFPFFVSHGRAFFDNRKKNNTTVLLF